MAATTPMSDAKAIVREMNDRLWTEKEYDAIGDLIADDFVQHGGPIPDEELHGKEAFEEYAKGVHAAFPDFEATVEQQLAEGDLVASRLTYTGTHEGEFMGIGATGEHATVPGMTISRIEDGKIAETWVTVDMASWMEQVGMKPMPA